LLYCRANHKTSPAKAEMKEKCVVAGIWHADRPVPGASLPERESCRIHAMAELGMTGI
jgi:hypothetical protein